MHVPLKLHPIGVIRTPHQAPAGTPIQSAYAGGMEGRVVVADRYAAALDDVEGFERLWLIYWMDRVGPFKPRIVPYRDTREHGLFATRSPCRPNPIGISPVRLLRREGPVLVVSDVDMLDGSPLLDLKPYVAVFDAHPGVRGGWFDRCGEDRRIADDRFHRDGDASGDDASIRSRHAEIGPAGAVVVQLGDHCIQTAALRARQDLVDRCLVDAEAAASLAEPIELLGDFLTGTDFAALRSDRPELAGGTALRVELRRQDDGSVGWSVVAVP